MICELPRLIPVSLQAGKNKSRFYYTKGSNTRTGPITRTRAKPSSKFTSTRWTLTKNIRKTISSPCNLYKNGQNFVHMGRKSPSLEMDIIRYCEAMCKVIIQSRWSKCFQIKRTHRGGANFPVYSPIPPIGNQYLTIPTTMIQCQENKRGLSRRSI